MFHTHMLFVLHLIKSILCRFVNLLSAPTVVLHPDLWHYFTIIQCNVLMIMRSCVCVQLLTKAPNARLGCSVTPGEEQEIKDHLFYRNINWQKLENHEVQPPFRPQIVSILYCVLLKVNLSIS